MMFIAALAVLAFAGTLTFAVWLPLSSKNVSPLSAYMVVIGSIFMYQFLPAVLLLTANSGNYIWLPELGGADSIVVTSLACVLATLIFTLAYYVPGRNGGSSNHYSENAQASKTIVFLILAAGLCLKLYVLGAAGGVEQNVIRLSGGLSDNFGLEDLPPALTFLRNFSGLADASATWLLVDSLRTRKSIWRAVAVFALVLGLTYLSTGKRLYLLWPLLTGAFGVHHYVRRFRFSDLPLATLLVLAFGFLSLLFRIYAPASLASVDIDLNYVDWAQGSVLKFYFLSLEFASFEMFTLAIEQSDRLVSMFGGAVAAFYTTNIEPLGYFIPRALWPSKPERFFDLSHAYRVFVSGGTLETGGGVAATLFGTSWTIAGFPGMCIAVLALARSCRLIDRRWGFRGHKSPLALCWNAFALVAMFHFFRQGTIAWSLIIIVLQQVGLIAGFLLIGGIGRLRRNRTKAGYPNA